MSLPDSHPRDGGLAARLAETRRFSETLCEPLSGEDMGLQACPEVSPPRWHLAHTTWFFETFILKPGLSGYQPFDERFEYLFNSYYNGVGAQYPRPQRHLLSRPGIDTVRRWRVQVDEAMQDLLASEDDPDLLALVALGIEHEQQHQELLLTDIKHSFSYNPLWPVYRPRDDDGARAAEFRWLNYPGGLVEIGATEGFYFDNETPRHRQWLEPFALANRPSTCAEYLAFIDDGGYRRPELWLSDGWDWVRASGATAPLYWFLEDGAPEYYTLAGRRPIQLHEPVAHLNYYEADAFARWCGKRLPTEAEWEHAAADRPVADGFVDNGRFHPSVAAAGDEADAPLQLFGDVWEWTGSAYLPYPGFAPAAGAVGEYNGKFMSNQMVLRGGSCVSHRDHLRASYRNFFQPHLRWQFSGVRLAQSMEAPVAHPQQLLPNLTFLDLQPPMTDAAREVATSLSAPRPTLDPKYFYDERGSALFDAITRTPEYYPTRTEASLLADHADAMAAELGSDLVIAEPGAGGCEKVRILLDRWRPSGYMPLEISRECLLDATRALAPRYPAVRFNAVCADYSQALSFPADDGGRPRLVFFPGSTIGNFEPSARGDFLRGLRHLAGDQGYLLIGADLQKDPARLNAAYNDAAGHTAAFNLNALHHLNRRLGCGFDPDAFVHRAFYNDREQRIEMHLECRRDQSITVGDRRIDLPAGSRIHTENSYKFTVEGFSRELMGAGFTPLSSWVDDDNLFSIHLARAA